MKETQVENKSAISEELDKFEKHIKELQEALDNIVLENITDVVKRLVAADKKYIILDKMPKLLAKLKELRELRANQTMDETKVRGAHELSELEKGEL